MKQSHKTILLWVLLIGVFFLLYNLFAGGGDSKEGPFFQVISDIEQKRVSADDDIVIDMVDVGGRKKGKPDPENGTVIMRMREVEDGGEHDSRVVQVSRHTEDEDVLALANYLIDLVEKHKKVSPAF